MPEAAVAPPPAAAAPAPAIPPTPAPAKAATGPAQAMPRPMRAKMDAALDKLAASQNPAAIAPATDQPKAQPPKPAPLDTTTNDPDQQKGPKEGDQDQKTNQPTDDKTTQAPEAGKDAKKPSPWKLYEEAKVKIAKLEKEVLESKAQSLAEQEKAQYLERIEKAEKRLKEFEDEARLTNYSKSEEFQQKYQKPYEAAWKRSMNELQGLTVPTDDVGGTRPFTVQDMLQLVNSDTISARKRANELYGDFANEVMLHRNEIRRMADEQSAAIEEAKVKGAEREKLLGETRTKTQREISQTVEKTFKEQHKAAMEDKDNSRFFTPKEGDDDWNAALEAGRKLTAQVFTDPDDPKLSQEDRVKLVKAQAAVFNRSAAYGPMKRLIGRLEKELADVKKENEGFKASRPDAAASRQTQATNGAPVKAQDRLWSSLDKLGAAR